MKRRKSKKERGEKKNNMDFQTGKNIVSQITTKPASSKFVPGPT